MDIICIGDLGRVKKSRDNHAPICALCFSVLLSFYTVIFLAFIQNLKNQVVYNSFGISFGLISYSMFPASVLSISFGFVIRKPLFLFLNNHPSHICKQ
jgi:hypothetical protein